MNIIVEYFCQRLENIVRKKFIYVIFQFVFESFPSWGHEVSGLLDKGFNPPKLCGFFSSIVLTLSSIYAHFNALKKKASGKHLWKKVKLLKMSNCAFFHNVFYKTCILKYLNSHILVVICSIFEFGMVSKKCIREWVKLFFC